MLLRNTLGLLNKCFLIVAGCIIFATLPASLGLQLNFPFSPRLGLLWDILKGEWWDAPLRHLWLIAVRVVHMAGAGGGNAPLPPSVAVATLSSRQLTGNRCLQAVQPELPMPVHARRWESTQHLTDAKLTTFKSNMAKFSCQLPNECPYFLLRCAL